jgi:hypothetical protein
VEFVAEGDLPSGSTIDYYVRNDADSAWVEYEDGDTPDDLAGVTGQRYYKIQATLTPDATGQVSPVLRIMGAREITIEDLSDVAEVVGITQGIDPITGKGAITEATIQAIQDGERDYGDAITTLLSSYDIGALEFRLWVGHHDSSVIDRSDWMSVENFLIDDYEVLSGAVRITGLSPLVLVRGKVPIYNTGTNVREPLLYNGTTLKATYDDLLDGQIALPGRRRGPGVEDDTTTVSKIIEDSDAKAELDAIAFLNGGGIISSQGRVKYVDLFGEKTIRAVFPSEELEPLSSSPGFKDRNPEYYVPYDWSADEGIYQGERRYYHAAALTKLGIARVEAPTILDPIVAEWITAATLADTVGDRMIEAFGTGLVTLSFRSTYAYPELEPGDLVAVQTDKFIARDPNTSKAIKGNLWVLGVVIGITGIWGQAFKVWVRGYEDIFATEATGDVTGFFKRFKALLHHNSDQDKGCDGAWTTLSFDDENYDDGMTAPDAPTDRWCHSTTTNNSRLTAPAKGTYRVTIEPAVVVTTVFSPQIDVDMRILKNGSTSVRQWSLETAEHTTNYRYTYEFSADVDLERDDYVEWQLYAASGGTGNMRFLGQPSGSLFGMIRRGV